MANYAATDSTIDPTVGTLYMTGWVEKVIRINFSGTSATWPQVQPGQSPA